MNESEKLDVERFQSERSSLGLTTEAYPFNGLSTKLPEGYMSYVEDEIVRVKGWLWRIEKVNRYRMILVPLTQVEVEKIVGVALLRVPKAPDGPSE